ncbi:AAEL007862-PA, partial [Aedes aegypti]
GSYKSYAGFSSRSVRTIWEQHDKQETEVAPEVYTKLAEDTTYKLWELANNIKTYSRHSSGRVTYDLVNEVLKDCDIPPIVGANNEPWDKIEYDGVYFFNSDEVLDLREEYIKDVSMEQSNIPVLTTSWMAESAIAEDLIELYNNICDAIYLGDEECFEEAIGILSTNAHVPSLMKLLLTKVIEMLGFEYTECTLERSLQFLEALVRNYHISHSDLTLELSLLSQIFVNLLLGAASFMQDKFIPAQPLNLDLQPHSQTSQLQQPLSINQAGTEPSPQRLGKQEQEPNLPEDHDDNASVQMSESSNGEVINPNSTTLESENITTLICADYLADEVSRVIGLCSSKWGFLEQECTFLLVERLQRYFGGDRKPDSIDYHWLGRVLRGLWSVGEFAFREVIPYLEKIDPDHVPEFVYPYLNNTGMFLRGKSDIFLYEYLQEVCGDGLMPFMFQYEHYIEAKHQKLHRLREKANQSKHCYRIPPKLLLNVHSKPCHLKPPPTIHDFFPERNEKQFPQSGQAPSSRFNFRFAGCRPVALKSNKARHTTGGRSSSIFGMGVAQENNDHGRDGLGHQQSLKQNAGLLRGFQAKVVIARRKLLRPDTNQYRPRRVYCLGSTNL